MEIVVSRWSDVSSLLLSPSSRRRLRPANANRSLLSSIHNTVVVIISHPEPLRFLIRSTGLPR